MRRFLAVRILALLAVVVLASCSKGDDIGTATDTRPHLTLITSTSGVGDNGYNDMILDGIMAYATPRDVVLSIISPKSLDEARTALQEWCAKETTSKQDFLILGSSEYETIITSIPDGVKSNKGVLLLESRKNDLPTGIHTMLLRRYGAAYLCGAMAEECPSATVIAASPDAAIVQPATKGFLAGYAVGGKAATVKYLADGDSGFNSPEKAYALTSDLPDDCFIFPLAGGSNSGVFKFARENAFTCQIIAGMDVDCSAYSTRTPYSLTVNVDKAITAFLKDWYEGKEMATHTEYGMAEGIVNVVVNNRFWDECQAWQDYYNQDDYWQTQYDKHYQTALKAERDYYEK